MLQVGLIEKLVVGAVGILILGGLYLAWSEHQRSIGAADQLAKQEKANAEFRVRANKGAVDFDTCDTAGGLFDFRKGTCQLP